jgi:hypothetical protein
MKKNVQQLSLWILSSILILSGCKKTHDLPVPGNQNPGQGKNSRYVQFILNNLPGQPADINGWRVEVSIINDQNLPVVTDTLLPLQFDVKYKSDSIQLPAGNYKLSKFIIIDAFNITRFATPVSNSPKAPLVQQPLHIAFAVPKPAISLINVEVLQIQATDQAQQYGYPDGSFTNGNADPASRSIKVWVQPLIKIGDIIYDSVPVSFTLTSWDVNGVKTVKNSTLAAGKTELTLSKDMATYQFQIKKWGTTDELTLSQNDLQEGAVYSLGGSRDAKKLRAELNYKLVDAVFKPQTKVAFEYDAAGKLSRMLHYVKNSDNSTSLAATENLEYNNGKIYRITKVNDQSTIQSLSLFTYNQGGKIVSFAHNEGGVHTTGDVQYISFDGGTGISGLHGISILYQYSDRYYTMNYNMQFKGGTLVEDAAVTSHHSSTMGVYHYDFNINPYIHLNLPDINFSNYSKHNINSQIKTFSLADQTFVPYDFEYKYDVDGYPTELVRKFSNSLNGQYAYTIKTVYNY